MNKIKVIIICLFSIGLYLDVCSQKLPEDEINNFFNYFKNDVEKAIDSLFVSNEYMNQNELSIDNLKSQLKNTIKVLGDYYGYDFIISKKVGESMQLLSYMVKFDRQPLRFTFIFYKPQNKWRIYNFQYDADLDEELEDAGNIFFIEGDK